MSEHTVQRARVLWQQSRQDLREAKRHLRRGEPLESSFFSLQGALNAMTCVCSLNGELRLPSHSPTQMAGLCAAVDERFASIAAACEALESVSERSPFAPDRDAADEREHGRLCHAHAQAVLDAARGYLKQNSRRFFRP